MPERAIDAFREQAAACLMLGSPFTSRVCSLVADELRPDAAFGRRILGRSGDVKRDALALRAAGGLHALARSSRCPELTAAYPPFTATDDMLRNAIETATVRHDAFLSAYLDSAPQTNEVSRSSAILGGCLWIAERTGLPLDLYEIGASAGLNLGFDRYAYDLGTAHWGSSAADVRIVSRWEGAMPPLGAPLSVRSRRGCDLNPLDPRKERDRERLLSYIWPDQSERLARIEAALAAAAQRGLAVEKAEAASWVEENFRSASGAGGVKVLFHTIVWQYLSAATRDRIRAIMRKAGATATVAAPVAWLRVEADRIEGSAGIRLTLWPTGEERMLGRTDFHGRWTAWNSDTVA